MKTKDFVKEQVRTIVGDKESQTWADKDIIACINVALRTLFGKAPASCFVDGIVLSAPSIASVSDNVPVDPSYYSALAHLTVYLLFLEQGEDEYNNKLAEQNYQHYLLALQ